MIKGSLFRGINYKCAMLYFNDQKYERAIKEFELIINPSDPMIYELIAKCYQNLKNNQKFLEFTQLAMTNYEKCGDGDKSQQMRNNL